MAKFKKDTPQTGAARASWENNVTASDEKRLAEYAEQIK